MKKVARRVISTNCITVLQTSGIPDVLGLCFGKFYFVNYLINKITLTLKLKQN